MTFLRPRMSVTRPLRSEPRTAPTSTAVVSASIWPLPSCQRSRRNGSAPEMTPVSNPKSRPPVAATVEMRVTVVRLR